MIGRCPNCCLLGHVTGLCFCLYVKIFPPSIFNLIDFWFSMSLIVLETELTEKNIFKEPGLFIDGSLQRFSFCPPKTFRATKHTTWNTSHLHGIAWSSGKLGYDKLFAVFCDIKVMNAEVFAKGLEKSRQLTRLLGQNVENFNDYGCPKFQDLIGEKKINSSWICSSYPFRHKTRLHCAGGRQMCMETGLCSFYLFKFCTCVLYLCLLLIYFFQIDIISSKAFILWILSVQN